MLYNNLFEEFVKDITPLCKKQEYAEYVREFLYLAKNKGYINWNNEGYVIENLRKIVWIAHLNPEDRMIGSKCVYITENQIKILINEQFDIEKRKLCIYRELANIILRNVFSKIGSNIFFFGTDKFYFLVEGFFAIEAAIASEVAEELLNVKVENRPYICKNDSVLNEIQCKSNLRFDEIYQEPAIMFSKSIFDIKRTSENKEEYDMKCFEKLIKKSFYVDFDILLKHIWYQKQFEYKFWDAIENLGKVYFYRQKALGYHIECFIPFSKGDKSVKRENVQGLYEDCIDFLDEIVKAKNCV